MNNSEKVLERLLMPLPATQFRFSVETSHENVNFTPSVEDFSLDCKNKLITISVREMSDGSLMNFIQRICDDKGFQLMLFLGRPTEDGHVDGIVIDDATVIKHKIKFSYKKNDTAKHLLKIKYRNLAEIHHELRETL